MSTKQKAEALIKAWCKNEGIKLTGKLRHVYPRAYVIGRAAPRCLVYATPWMDAEPQIQSMRTALIAKSGLGTANVFDELLNSGDWCAVAYVITAGWSAPVAVSWGQS